MPGHSLSPLELVNRSWFLSLNAPEGTPAWLISLATALANGLIYLVPLLLLSLWLLGLRGKSLHDSRGLALRACLTTLLALGANQVIILLWQHPRPFMIGLGHAWMEHAADSSFPSDHMTVFSAIGLTLLAGGAPAPGVLTLLAGLCVAWARVFLGVHFPLDMTGAFVVATIVCVVVAPLWRTAGSPLTRLVEAIYRRVLAWPIARGWLRG